MAETQVFEFGPCFEVQTQVENQGHQLILHFVYLPSGARVKFSPEADYVQEHGLDSVHIGGYVVELERVVQPFDLKTVVMETTHVLQPQLYAWLLKRLAGYYEYGFTPADLATDAGKVRLQQQIQGKADQLYRAIQVRLGHSVSTQAPDPRLVFGGQPSAKTVLTSPDGPIVVDTDTLYKL